MMQEEQQVKKDKEESLWGDILNFGLRLMLVCAIAAAGLGLTYGAVKNNIAKMEQEEKEEGARKVLEAAGLTAVEDAELLAIVQGGSEDLEENMISVFRGENASGRTDGYAFVLKAKGYNFMTMAVGVDRKGKVTGVTWSSRKRRPASARCRPRARNTSASTRAWGPTPCN